ncbi:glycosyltransferase family 4 protein [Pontiella agarivorans]|uniref:Glycosyltransferase family 4 protein n=1 Tax=Pontiella agarivorans TaxID=3038953 RepID=A0ABU5MT87_9BACT|nr:glycosyltransferase family 4 protein [Pontiella agarivorans]MDZ8117328.1 glycosyltransferase family 4 protein [Pontiella agarivorans]
MKKILYFENTGNGTGSSKSLKAILSLLDRQVYEVVLWFGDKGNRELWSGENVHESRVGWIGNYDFFPASFSCIWLKHFIGFLIKSVRDSISVPLKLKEFSPDIIHINSGSCLILGIIGKWMGIPVVWHIRELICPNWLGRIQDFIYARTASVIITISDAVMERLPYSCEHGNVVRLYNAIGRLEVPDEERVSSFRNRWNIPKGHLIVLLLGHVSKVKGYEFMADVADALRQENIYFILAGRDDSRSSDRIFSIKERWQLHVEEGRACFCGQVDPALAINVADLIICPNLVPEPLGRTVVEAYRFDTPVMAMNMPAFTETIRHGESGWLLNEDPQVWADQLRTVSANRDVLKAYRSGIRAMNEIFDDEKYMKTLDEIYSGLVGGSESDDC